MALLLSSSAPFAAAGIASDGTPGQGTLEAEDAAGKLVPMPLRHTDVRAQVTGFVARVDVVQTFGNPFDLPIEARYVFPLPERAAVDDFALEVGDRRIHGEIRRREEARKTYEAARAAGYTASLLDQERPNVFTQSVSNIAPGKEIKIHLRYIDLLPFSDGAYRFLYPMVVGPRYSPAGAAPPPAAGGGPSSPAYLEPGRRTSHDISVSVDLDAGVPIHSITSESHKIVVSNLGPNRAQVTLAPGDTLPNKDLMLRWAVAGDLPEIGVLAHREDDDGFFALLIQPKAEVTADEAAPKEIIFVLDQSGSMSGLPIAMSQRFMRLALQTLGPQDRFNIVRFDSSASVLAPEPLSNTQENVQRGLAAVSEMRGSGGTEMLAGFDAALAQPRDPSCIRIVIFLTDGYIGNEEDIFRVIRERRGDARIFTLGVGSSVNHHLLRGMADIGHGAYEYVRPDGREKEAVETFHRWVTKPYLTDLTIDWGSLRVEDVQPSQLPDLYSGQTLSVVGRYLWGGSDSLIVRGRLGGVPWEKEIEVTLPDRSENHEALGSVWARQRIQDWQMQLPADPGGASRPGIEAQITSLALAFHLMSPFTSFVAVDDSIVVHPGGNPVRVDQPLPMPEFVSFEGCFGVGGPGRAEALGLPARTVAPGIPASNGAIRPVEGAASPGSAALRGVVLDSEGAALPGVPITVESRTRPGSRKTVMTGMNGDFRFQRLSPANDYTLVVTYPGFVPIEVGPIDLEAGRTAAQDVTLRTQEEMEARVEVVAHGSLVDTVSTETTGTFNTEFIEGLPIIGHNFQDILTLSPGVSDTDGDGNPNVQGCRATGLQLRIDGGNAAHPASGNIGQNLDSDEIEEIEVIVSGSSAEFGRADGGFVKIVTNSGVDSRVDPARGQLSVPAWPAYGRLQGAPASVAESALHVLADLADDGRLSRSEGLPALAGLLGAQYSDGGLSLSVRVQALATWALAAAAEAEPRLPWLSEKARTAAEFLAMMRASSGTLEPDDDAWVDSILERVLASGPDDESPVTIDGTPRCHDPRSSLERLRMEMGPGAARTIDRILAGTRVAPARTDARAPRG